MSGKDQNRFEDYLELERYIEALQTDQPACLPPDMTPSQARIYGMAAFMRSTLPEAAEPRQEFVEQLQARLFAKGSLDQSQVSQEGMEDTAFPVEGDPAAEAEQDLRQKRNQTQETPAQQEGQRVAKKTPFVSRRGLITGGAVAAASLAVGTGIGTALHHDQNSGSSAPKSSAKYRYPPLVPSGPEGIQTTWHFVTTISQLGDGAVQFMTDSVIGYVLKASDQKTGAGNKTEIIALSAACTHMGCIVQWQDSDRQFHCPCHGGMFSASGKPATNGALRYLVALPRLNIKIEDGNIYVEVPKLKS